MAANRVQVFSLDVDTQFQGLKDQEKLYAHHMARAAWLGTRIILRQVSPESHGIFDFILELHHTCSGNWQSLVGPDVSSDDLKGFLTNAATFLSNVGNYYGSGDQKFVPGIESIVLQTLATKSPRLAELYEDIHSSIYTRPPFSLGYPSQATQSSYYPGDSINESDITMVSKVLESNTIFPENTRVRKAKDSSRFEVLIASASDEEGSHFPLPNDEGSTRLVKGDHAG